MIGAGTLNCELRYLTATPTSGVLSLSSALSFDHPSTDLVRATVGMIVYPTDFGVVGGEADSWQGLQRMLYQVSSNLSLYGPVIEGAQGAYFISQPLTAGQHTMRNIRFISTTTTAFSPVDTNNAMFMLGKTHVPFTATASDNTVAVVSPAVVPPLNDPLLINNMYGETVPGGLVSGRNYYVKTRADQQHCTLSETVGGAEVDITSDGGGWFCPQVGELSKCWWENVYLSVNTADLNGAIIGMQQPGEIKRLRVDMLQPCTITTYGLLFLSTQIARLYNPEFVVNGATNVVALGIGPNLSHASVAGLHVQDANFDGNSDSGQTHIVIGGAATCDGVVIDGQTWLEGAGDAGIRIDSGRAIKIGPIYASGSPTNGVVYENTLGSSWEVGPIIHASSSKTILQTSDGVLFKTSGSADSVETDSSFVFGGARRFQRSGTTAGLILRDRVYVAGVVADYSARYIDETIDVSAAGAARTITLRSAVGMSGIRHTIIKNEAGANAVNVATVSSQTIDGAASPYVIAGGAKGFVTVVSDGANWKVVNKA